MKVYAYVMVWNTGFAPSVYKGILSLACCKTSLRYKIGKKIWDEKEDIYVIGVCGKQMAKRNDKSDSYFYSPVYIAKITDVLSCYDYYEKYSSRPDGVYEFKENSWKSKQGNPHSLDPYDCKSNKDLWYRKKEENFVLISDKYRYYGKELLQKIDFAQEFIEPIAQKLNRSPRSDLKELDYSDKEEVIHEYIEKLISENSISNDKGSTLDWYFK